MLGLANSVYLLGQVGGAILFGRLTDRFSRKRLFLVTLGLYLGATAATGMASSFGVFALFRLLAGAGIGGEYAAINSAIDELVPARIRGQVDLAINGSYWVGVAAGAGLSVLFLNPRFLPIELGWRLVFGLGALLGLVILLVRRDVPESPRWLLMHGVFLQRYLLQLRAHIAEISWRSRGSCRLLHFALCLRQLPGTLVAWATLRSLGPPSNDFGSVCNLRGPIVSKRRAFLRWAARCLDETLCWCCVFFFASSAASSAYLTVSDLFPVEMRGVAIALFFAIETGAGAVAPSLFGRIVDDGSRGRLFAGYALASLMMVIAAAVARRLCVASERKGLEAITSHDSR